MKAKLLYVVVSDMSDLYLDEAVVSAYSARKHNSDAYIELIVDQDTSRTISTEKSYAYHYFDEVTRIDVPADLTKRQRSRYLKTNLRKFVTGDYLFIDSDTIICSQLDSIEENKCDICAVREYNKISHFTPTDWWMNYLAEKAEIVSEILDEPYFNSGVMYVKDTPTSHKLYERWYECWKKTLAKGLDTDQTALCWANKLEGHVIKHIDDSWNCIVKKSGKDYLSQAKIIHYLSEHKGENYPLSKKSIYRSVKEMGGIPAFVEDMISTPKLFFVSYEDVLLTEQVHDLQNRFSRFYRFVAWLCRIYVHIRVKWINNNRRK